jgi:hypothetical protein
MNEPLEYLFVILDYNGVCWIVRDQTTERAQGLPALLAEGWRPVRETPFSGSGMAPYVLILLERGDKNRGGDFGFA